MKKIPLFSLIAGILISSLWLGCIEHQTTGPDQADQSVFSPLAKNSASGLIRVNDALKNHTEKLLENPGIVGVGAGVGSNGSHAVIVLTKNEGIKGIPGQLDGVPVTIRVTGTFYALQGEPGPASEWPRPVPIGISTGHPDITAGTIGCRVKDGNGNLYALSNNHVYANENQANIGDNVLQPGPYDGGLNPEHTIGTLFDYEPIMFGSKPQNANYIDAAIAATDASSVGTSTPSDGYGTPGTAVVEAYVGLGVQKYGRTTGLTKGAVTIINVTVKVQYDRGTARFKNQIIIEPGNFSSGGDSGSLIVDITDNNPVGLLYAGSSTHTIANRIQAVLDRFGVTVDGAIPAKGSIVGQVTDFADVPISGATVSDGARSATTDGGGVYTIADVPVGVYTVTASAGGYLTGSQSGVSVTDGAAATADFSLVNEPPPPPSGTVSGNISDGANGIAGATVTVEGLALSAITDSDGNYSVNVPVGSGYTLSASADGYESASQINVEVTEGANTTVNITLVLSQTTITIKSDKSSYSIGESVTISGTIMNGPTPVAGAVVSLLIHPPKGPNWVPGQAPVTDSNGDYSFAFTLVNQMGKGAYTATGSYQSVLAVTDFTVTK